MDDADWDSAVQGLAMTSPEIMTLGRCLEVEAHLRRWRADQEVLAGTLASDALDQALGLLQELAGGEAARLVEVVTRLLAELPPSLD